MAHFTDMLKNDPDTCTLNGMPAFSTTQDANLDLFYHLVRTIDCEDLHTLLDLAWKEDPLTCTKIMFNSRDCRKDSVGKGDRKPFYAFIDWLIRNDCGHVVEKNLESVVELGYWKDLIHLCSNDTLHDNHPQTKIADKAMDMIVTQLEKDKTAMANKKPVSLLGKYLPGEGKANAGIQKKLIKRLRTNNKQYRKLKAALGQYCKVVEQKMSSNDWKNIEYSLVPSVAMNRYRKAYARQDPERFNSFLTRVKQGKESINASQVYPHELVRPYVTGETKEPDQVIEQQWNELAKNAAKLKGTLVMVDVSGSMTCDNSLPMCVSVALGLLTAQVNHPPWNDLVLTFSATPKFHHVPAANTAEGKTLFDRVNNIIQADWGMNTNFEAALDLIYEKAKKFEAKAEEYPQRLLVISDMQFDQAVHRSGNLAHAFQMAKAQGLEQIVFWNVSKLSKGSTPVTKDVSGALLLSGYSPNMMSALVDFGHVLTPIEFLTNILNHPRYANISV